MDMVFPSSSVGIELLICGAKCDGGLLRQLTEDRLIKARLVGPHLIPVWRIGCGRYRRQHACSRMGNFLDHLGRRALAIKTHDAGGDRPRGAVPHALFENSGEAGEHAGCRERGMQASLGVARSQSKRMTPAAIDPEVPSRTHCSRTAERRENMRAAVSGACKPVLAARIPAVSTISS